MEGKENVVNDHASDEESSFALNNETIPLQQPQGNAIVISSNITAPIEVKPVVQNTTDLEDNDGNPPFLMKKKERLEKFATTEKMNFPISYRTNSPKEDLCLEFVEHFRSQYVQLFPTRPPLMLSPENECKLKKFICTFVRPTELPYAELYDYDTCSSYVANYITYEPLEDPEKLPSVVVSPTTTLAWQSGDCFDMTVLLLSLLLGSGHKAYGVIGYASREIVVNDQSNRNCPETVPEEPDPEKVVESNVAATTKYTSQLRRRPDLTSKFQKELDEKKRLEREGDRKSVV